MRCTSRLAPRGELDDKVDVAPVDAEVERRGADHGPQVATRHRRLDLAPLLGRQRAVVQADRQVVLVHRPQRLENELGLPAGVDEDQRHAGAADDVVDLRQGVQAGVARPRHLALRDEDVDHRRGAGVAADDGDCGGASFSPWGRRWLAERDG